MFKYIIGIERESGSHVELALTTCIPARIDMPFDNPRCQPYISCCGDRKSLTIISNKYRILFLLLCCGVIELCGKRFQFQVIALLCKKTAAPMSFNNKLLICVIITILSQEMLTSYRKEWHIQVFFCHFLHSNHRCSKKVKCIFDQLVKVMRISISHLKYFPYT